MPANDKVIAMVTCSSMKEARSIAQALVTKRLAACVNIIGTPVHSIYRWKEKVESATEYLLLIKTARRLLSRASAAVVGLHSYEIPEFIVLPIVGGSPGYLRWLEDCLAKPAPKPARGRR